MTLSEQWNFFLMLHVDGLVMVTQSIDNNINGMGGRTMTQGSLQLGKPGRMPDSY